MSCFKVKVNHGHSDVSKEIAQKVTEKLSQIKTQREKDGQQKEDVDEEEEEEEEDEAESSYDTDSVYFSYPLIPKLSSSQIKSSIEPSCEFCYTRVCVCSLVRSYP